MQCEISAQEAYKLVSKAMGAYNASDVNSISRRTRVLAMSKFIAYVKQQSPQKKISVTLEDYLLLTELPEKLWERASVYDIETNGLLDELSTIWCIGIASADDGKVQTYTDHDPNLPRPIEGIERLSTADRVIGHNVIGFDMPAINKLFPGHAPLRATVGHNGCRRATRT